MHTDVSLKEKQTQYEQRVAAVVGRCISTVRYYEIAYEESQLYWDNGQFHSLDFGLDLKMEDGCRFKISWDSEFYQYEISLSEGSLADQLAESVAMWDVSNHPKWKPLLHNEIVDAKVYWSWVEFTTWQKQDSLGRHLRQLFQKPERRDYPQDVELVFASGGRAFFSAAQYLKDEDKLFGMSDEVTVIFSDEVAARYEVGSYAQER